MFFSPGDSKRSSLLLVASGRSAHRPSVPALCPLHDQPQRPSGENPAHPHISAEHPQQLELPCSKHTSFWTFFFSFPKIKLQVLPPLPANNS